MKRVIYRISNTINSKIYIGSAVVFSRRKASHKFHLKNKSHANRILQNFVNKYSLDVLVFDVLESNCVNLIEREQFYMDTLNPEFNIRKIAESNYGTKRTKQQIQNIIDGRNRNGGYRKGFKLSQETIDLIKKTRIANGGYKVSEEQKRNHSLIMTGKKHTEKQNLEKSIRQKNIKMSEKTKSKLSKALMGNTNWKFIDYKNKDRNKKISDSMRKRMSKKVINIETGEIFNSAKLASESINMPSSTFSKHLSGFNKTNQTKFKYL